MKFALVADYRSNLGILLFEIFITVCPADALATAALTSLDHDRIANLGSNLEPLLKGVNASFPEQIFGDLALGTTNNRSISHSHQSGT